MSKPSVEWQGHVEAYKRSGKSLLGYCKDADVKITTMRHYVYKKNAKNPAKKVKSSFFQLPIVNEIVITRMPNGELSLRGFDARDLATLVKAWSHAVQD